MVMNSIKHAYRLTLLMLSALQFSSGFAQNNNSDSIPSVHGIRIEKNKVYPTYTIENQSAKASREFIQASILISPHEKIKLLCNDGTWYREDEKIPGNWILCDTTTLNRHLSMYAQVVKTTHLGKYLIQSSFTAEKRSEFPIQVLTSYGDIMDSLDLNGNPVYPPNYPSEKKFFIYNLSKKKLLNVPDNFSYYKVCGKQLLCYRSESRLNDQLRFSLIDPAKEEVVFTDKKITDFMRDPSLLQKIPGMEDAIILDTNLQCFFADYCESAIIRKKDKVGVFNFLSWNWTVAPIYDFMHEINSDNILAVKNNKLGMLNSKFEEIMPFEYDSLHLIPCFKYENNQWFAQSEKGSLSFNNIDKKWKKIPYAVSECTNGNLENIFIRIVNNQIYIQHHRQKVYDPIPEGFNLVEENGTAYMLDPDEIRFNISFTPEISKSLIYDIKNKTYIFQSLNQNSIMEYNGKKLFYKTTEKKDSIFTIININGDQQNFPEASDAFWQSILNTTILGKYALSPETYMIKTGAGTGVFSLKHGKWVIENIYDTIFFYPNTGIFYPIKNKSAGAFLFNGQKILDVKYSCFETSTDSRYIFVNDSLAFENYTLSSNPELYDVTKLSIMQEDNFGYLTDFFSLNLIDDSWYLNYGTQIKWPFVYYNEFGEEFYIENLTDYEKITGSSIRSHFEVWNAPTELKKADLFRIDVAGSYIINIDANGKQDLYDKNLNPISDNIYRYSMYSIPEFILVQKKNTVAYINENMEYLENLYMEEDYSTFSIPESHLFFKGKPYELPEGYKPIHALYGNWLLGYKVENENDVKSVKLKAFYIDQEGKSKITATLHHFRDELYSTENQQCISVPWSIDSNRVEYINMQKGTITKKEIEYNVPQLTTYYKNGSSYIYPFFYIEGNDRMEVFHLNGEKIADYSRDSSYIKHMSDQSLMVYSPQQSILFSANAPEIIINGKQHFEKIENQIFITENNGGVFSLKDLNGTEKLRINPIPEGTYSIIPSEEADNEWMVRNNSNYSYYILHYKYGKWTSNGILIDSSSVLSLNGLMYRVQYSKNTTLLCSPYDEVLFKIPFIAEFNTIPNFDDYLLYRPKGSENNYSVYHCYNKQSLLWEWPAQSWQLNYENDPVLNAVFVCSPKGTSSEILRIKEKNSQLEINKEAIPFTLYDNGVLYNSFLGYNNDKKCLVEFDLNGKIIEQLYYSKSIVNPEENLMLVERASDKKTIVIRNSDIKFQEADFELPDSAAYISRYDSGAIKIVKNGKTGVFDLVTGLYVKPLFNQISYPILASGFALADDKLLDLKTGNTFLGKAYSNFSIVQDSFLFCKKQNEGFVKFDLLRDPQFNLVNETRVPYYPVSLVHPELNELAFAEDSSGKIGVANLKQNKWLVKAENTNLQNIYHASFIGYAGETSDKYVVYDQQGNKMFGGQSFDMITTESDDYNNELYFVIKKNEKYSLTDKKGKTLIPFSDKSPSLFNYSPLCLNYKMVNVKGQDLDFYEIRNIKTGEVLFPFQQLTIELVTDDPDNHKAKITNSKGEEFLIDLTNPKGVKKQ